MRESAARRHRRGVLSSEITMILFFGLMLAACEPEPVKTRGLTARVSQKRLPGETFDQAEFRFRSGLDALSLDAYTSSLSVKNSTTAFADLKATSADDFESVELLQTAFERLRDYQFLQSATHPEIERRSTWLYPDDGCYARADLAVQNLKSWKYPAVDKIFVFGDLTVSTANAIEGEVTWWFHVAPLARISEDLFVLDPAIEPSEPLALEDWLTKMTSDISSLKVASCLASAYSPYSRCEVPGDSDSGRAMVDQQEFLDPEWERLVELGRIPEDELGDSPPWK